MERRHLITHFPIVIKKKTFELVRDRRNISQNESVFEKHTVLNEEKMTVFTMRSEVERCLTTLTPCGSGCLN